MHNTSMLPTAPSLARDPRTRNVVAFYESLTPASLPQLRLIYADDARFIDPFNDVSGLGAIQHVFEHMFATLDAPRFEVTQTVTEGEHCLLLWNFRFRREGRPGLVLIHGSTHLHFAQDGRIAWHRDYWDPARELYESLPVLGALMRWLRRRLSAAAWRAEAGIARNRSGG